MQAKGFTEHKGENCDLRLLYYHVGWHSCLLKNSIMMQLLGLSKAPLNSIIPSVSVVF